MLSRKEQIKLFCSRYNVNAAEASENLAIDKECKYYGFRNPFKNEESFNEYFDWLESLVE